MKKALLFIVAVLSLNMFSQVSLPDDATFYESVLLDMVNVYDTVYIYQNTKRTILDHLYLNPLNTFLFNCSDYLIKGHKISILNDDQLNKLIKREKRIGFISFKPKIKTEGRLEITVSFLGGVYKKNKPYKVIIECEFYTLIYKYNPEANKWEFVKYENCITSQTNNNAK